MRSVALWAIAVLAMLSLQPDLQARTAATLVPPSSSAPPRVIVLGVPGLRWSDVDPVRMPALSRLAARGAAGALSVRTAAAVDCPADAWLTLSAGNRAVALGPSAARCAPALPSARSMPAQRRANAARREGAVPGLLADALNRQRRCVNGGAPTLPNAGGRLAAADGSGGLAGGDCAVLVVAAPAVGHAHAKTGEPAAADAVIARYDRLRPPGSTLLVLGLSEAPDERSSHLHVALAVGPQFRPGSLTSASVRRPPYVQLIDVAPTVLSLLDVRVPAAMTGQPWRATGTPISRAALRDEDRQAVGQQAVTVPFFLTLVGLELALTATGLVLRRWRLVELVGLSGVCALGGSFLANLYPWWRTAEPMVAVLVAAGVATAALTAICLLGRGVLGRAGLACALTVGVLVTDLLTGSRLQMSSVAGYSPLVAGRFAGIGNVAFGILAAAALLAAASRGSAKVAALTGLVVVVDGAPMWGSDVGGVLALTPACALLVLLLAGRAVSALRLVIAGLVGVLVVTGFAVADHARPADAQTHLGRFVGQVLTGSAGAEIRRKAEANAALLFHSPVTALLPVVLALAVVLFLRPPGPLRTVLEDQPAWRAGLLAVLLAGGLGFALNDSGAGVLALALLVTFPATLAVVARPARESTSAG